MNWLYLLAGVFIAYWFFGTGGFMAQSNELLERMAEAIKRFEGWFPGSVSYRNNNPGNLKFRGQPGAIGQDEQGHAIFDTYENGWKALLNQLRLIIYGGSQVYKPDMTFYDVFSRYAEANSKEYAEFVAASLGVPPTVRMQDLPKLVKV